MANNNDNDNNNDNRVDDCVSVLPRWSWWYTVVMLVLTIIFIQ